MDRMKSAEGQKGTDNYSIVSPEGQISKNATKEQKTVSTLFNKPILSYKMRPFFVRLQRYTKNCKDKCT